MGTRNLSFTPKPMLISRLPVGLDVLWRVYAQRYSVIIDADREEYGTSNPELLAVWYQVERRTPHGAWIYYDDGPKFIRLTANKRFACNTLDEALESFIARKQRQAKILNAQLAAARDDLEMGLLELKSMRGEV